MAFVTDRDGDFGLLLGILGSLSTNFIGFKKYISDYF